jgi:hypothetical protein
MDIIDFRAFLYTYKPSDESMPHPVRPEKVLIGLTVSVLIMNGNSVEAGKGEGH